MYSLHDDSLRSIGQILKCVESVIPSPILIKLGPRRMVSDLRHGDTILWAKSRPQSDGPKFRIKTSNDRLIWTCRWLYLYRFSWLRYPSDILPLFPCSPKSRRDPDSRVRVAHSHDRGAKGCVVHGPSCRGRVRWRRSCFQALGLKRGTSHNVPETHWLKTKKGRKKDDDEFSIRELHIYWRFRRVVRVKYV